MWIRIWLVGLWLGCACPAGWAQGSAFSEEEKDVLSQLEDIIELHDWLALLDRSDPPQREAQLKSGMTHVQYVAELLGLFYEGNSIAGEDGEIQPTDLNRIRQLSWKRKGTPPGGGGESILGTVQLDDGQSLLIEIQWRKLPDGRYVLTGPLG